MRPFRRLKVLLVVLVIAHLGIAVVHGIAHDNAMVSLSPAATAFVYIVILIAPLAGLAITLLKPRGGAALVSASMVGALIFGVVNHFLLSSPDHVSQVEDRKSTRLNSSHIQKSRMPSSA